MLITSNMKECEERLRFESLLVDISSRFINLPSEKVADEIDCALRQVCECLELDLSALWRWEADSPNIYILTHAYRRFEGAPIPERMEASEVNPWAFDEVLGKRRIVFSSIDEAPPEAERDMETWKLFGIKNVLCFPLCVGGREPFGAISFHDLVDERTWSDGLVDRLQVVADVFAGALVRQRYEQALMESDERLKLAVDAVDAGIWVWSNEREEFWLSDRLAEFFGLQPGEVLPVDGWTGMMHEDDRVRAMEALQEGLSSGELAQVEYRIVEPDGGIRWMHARGRSCATKDGEQRFLGIAGDVTKQKESELKLAETLKEVDELRKRLKEENVYLRDHLRDAEGHGEVLGNSPATRSMLDLAARVAKTDATVLITGETGTGKELLARYIHDHSDRSKRAMVCVNCAALPAPLIESELFGREKGAYTGAMTKQVGRFEIADGSTLFLDEIGDLPMELQSKLLRVLQDGTFEKLGSHKTQQADVRVIAATNADLSEMVRAGTFREDLFHRLNVFPIVSPPLRNRSEDIPELTWNFVREFNNKMGRSVNAVPVEVMEALRAYDWPGNIRELRNLIERAMILAEGKTLVMEPLQSGCFCKENTSLEKVERKHIEEVLEQSNWQIGGSGGAAERLGLPRTTLNSRIKKLGIVRR